MILIYEHLTKLQLGFHRLVAEDNKLLTRQASVEAMLIELVFVRGEAPQVLALVSDLLLRTLGAEPRQIPFEGPQCSLAQFSL
jgi:hypothetical protein